MAVYVLDENNNRKEALDKEGVLALLDKAIKDGSLEGITGDEAFISKLKCCVSGGTYSVAFVKQATFNTLEANNNLVSNCYYFIIDDTTADDLDEQLKSNLNDIENIKARLNELGFKEGVFEIDAESSAYEISVNNIKKQGKYAIGNLLLTVWINQEATLRIPSQFRPKEKTKIMASYLNEFYMQFLTMDLWLGTDGKVYQNEDLTTEALFTSTQTMQGTYQIINSGWELA